MECYLLGGLRILIEEAGTRIYRMNVARRLVEGRVARHRGCGAALSGVWEAPVHLFILLLW